MCVTFQINMFKEKILLLPITTRMAVEIFIDALPRMDISLSEENIAQIDRCLKCGPATEFFYCQRGTAAINELFCRNCGGAIFLILD